MRSKIIGYIVAETCEDYEQVLGLRRDDRTPFNGVLEWTDGPRAMFKSRSDARSAIDRTDHYRQAFNLTTGKDSLPEKKFCRILSVRAA